MGEIVLNDGGPMERFERLLALPDGEVMGEVCGRVLGGDSLGVIARDFGVPAARFMVWVMGDEGRRGEYEGALRARADELVHESLGDVEDKDRAGHKLKVAGLWDRRRFGRGEDGSGGMRVVVVRFGAESGEREVTEVREG